MQNFINVINDFWGSVVAFYNANDLLILFIVLNVTNVIIQTIKSLATVKCGKTVAALGLKKIGQSKEFVDCATLQGQLKVVSHLVKVEKA